MFCSTTPGKNLIENCNLTDNLLAAVMSPWETLLGGFFGPVFWGLIVLAVYAKYRNAMMALLAGLIPLFAIIALIPGGEIGKIVILIISAAGLALYATLHARVETPQT